MSDDYMFPNRADIINNDCFHILKKQKIGYKRKKKAIILPTINGNYNSGGVCDSRMKFLNYSKMDVGWLKRGGNYYFNKNNIESKEMKVIFLGFFVKHWGHFLIDCMDRAWILTRPEFDDYKVCFLEENGRSISGNYKKMLNYLGVSTERLVEIKRPTKFSEVVIPDVCRKNSVTFYPEYMSIFKKVLSNIDLSKYKIEDNIYLSRRHLKNVQEIGERDIENAFRNNGFIIKYPEELPFEEQVAIFQKAKTVACINGSIPLNGVFASSKTKIIILNKMSLRHQNMLNIGSLKGLNIIYVDIYYEPLKKHPKALGEGPFWIEVNENLNNFFLRNGYKRAKVSDKHKVNNYFHYYGLYYRNKVVKELVKIKHKVLA